MKVSVRIASLASLLVLGLGAAATTTQAGFSNGDNINSFEGGLAAGYYANPLTHAPNGTAFSPLGGTVGSSLNYSSGGFGYTLADSIGIAYGGGSSPYLYAISASDTFTITFTGVSINAVGLDLFVVNSSVVPVNGGAVNLSVTASTVTNGVTTSIQDAGLTTSSGSGYFVDFTTTGLITSLTFSSNGSYYPALTNLIVGNVFVPATVPEPSSLALLVTGSLISLIGYRRKAARSRRPKVAGDVAL